MEDLAYIVYIICFSRNYRSSPMDLGDEPTVAGFNFTCTRLTLESGAGLELVTLQPELDTFYSHGLSRFDYL